MSRNQSLKIIKQEIERLNQRIDLKIIQGRRYTAESKMHKMLLERIKKMRKPSFFSRLSQALAH